MSNKNTSKVKAPLPKKRGDLAQLIKHMRKYIQFSDEGIRKLVNKGNEPDNEIIAKQWRRGLDAFPGYN